jgi:hypothetical protein
MDYPLHTTAELVLSQDAARAAWSERAPGARPGTPVSPGESSRAWLLLSGKARGPRVRA